MFIPQQKNTAPAVTSRNGIHTLSPKETIALLKHFSQLNYVDLFRHLNIIQIETVTFILIKKGPALRPAPKNDTIIPSTRILYHLSGHPVNQNVWLGVIFIQKIRKDDILWQFLKMKLKIHTL